VGKKGLGALLATSAMVRPPLPEIKTVTSTVTSVQSCLCLFHYLMWINEPVLTSASHSAEAGGRRFHLLDLLRIDGHL